MGKCRIAHDPILGTMKSCSKCGEWWPLDEEFYYRNRTCNKFYSECRACYREWDAKRRVRTGRKPGRPRKVIEAGVTG